MTPVSYYLIYLASLALPAIIGLFTWKRAQLRYRPIIVFIWLLFAWELASVIVGQGYLSDFAWNTRSLMESLAILWIARKWNLFEKRPALYYLLPALVTLAWGADQLINGWNQVISWSGVLLSLLNITIATLFLTRTLFSSFSVLLRNPVFLFGSALVIQYGLAVVLEGILLIIRPSGKLITESFFYAGIGFGFAINLIYLKTMLCISKTAKYSLA